jgi:hypothetical protein
MILDQPSKFTISHTAENAEIETLVSLSQSGESPLVKLRGTDSKDVSGFEVDRMYYVIVKVLDDEVPDNAQHSIMIQQDRTIIRLSDGVPQKVRFNGKDDLSKLFIFAIPDGSYTFSVQIKSQTEDFYPKLYVKYYEDLETQYRNLEFPPGGEPGYFICKNWDYKLGLLNYQERFEGINGGKAGLALNMLEVSNTNEISFAVITVSASPVIKMLGGTTYMGSLDHLTSFKIYQIDESLLSRNGTVLIEFTPCVGSFNFKVIENLNKPNQEVEVPFDISTNFLR